MKLVIVESPSKCKSISTYLGKGYKCIATNGHLQRLVPDANIDVDNLKYEKMKSKQLAVIKNEISLAKEVILATDDDREGETIAWHVCILFNLPVETTQRIIFHEITEEAIQYAIANPTIINMNIVHSQQARAVVDVLIGYNMTPVLWKHLSDKDLSAGRCQTPALRLLWENQKKIDDHGISLLKYKANGYFFGMNIVFDFDIKEENVYSWLESLKDLKFVFKREIIVKTYAPPDPLTTSSLQQLASKTYNISPNDTMKYSQTLYENGFITYIRTDCKKYNEGFLSLIEKYIGKEFFNKTLDLKTVGDCPHEAIRPTNITRREIEGTPKEKKIYKLIWEKTMQSCMADSVWNVVVCKLEGRPGTVFTKSAKQAIFLGWENNKENKENKGENRESKEYNFLTQLPQDVAYPCKKIIASPICSTGPDHICEASLIKKLEDHGIGRPSTYASILEKIKSKKYAVCDHVSGVETTYNEYVANFSPFCIETNSITKIIGNEKNKLIIQPIGKRIMEVFEKQSLLDTVFDYEYTNKMETELDNIRDGNTSWKEMCNSSKKFIEGLVGEVTTTTVKDLPESITTVKDLSESTFIREPNKIIGYHHGHAVVIQKGKFGTYAAIDDAINISLFKFGNRPISNISFEEIKNEITKEQMETCKVNIVRNISKNISIRKGEWGNYIYYKTSVMKSPKFYKLNGFTEDYETCNLSLLQLWIKEKYRIE
jgi:DNA topoisomerase I